MLRELLVNENYYVLFVQALIFFRLYGQGLSEFIH